MDIREVTIGKDGYAWVCAEIGHNHGGDMDRAFQLIEAAAYAGADAVKFQRRNNHLLYTRALYDSPYDNPNSYGPTYGQHREALELTPAQHAGLATAAHSYGLAYGCTPFDPVAVDQIGGIVDFVKIASGDITNVNLIHRASLLGKPLILSCGGADWNDVQRALGVAGPAALLHCTMAYPTQPEDLHLSVIPKLAEWADPVGASLHDSGISSAVVAYMLGARIIEKHFTLNRAWKGTDNAFSLEPQGLRKMVRDLERARLSLGSPEKQVLPVEYGAMTKMRKSLYTSRALPAGHTIRWSDLKPCSPWHPLGWPLYRWSELVGSMVKGDLDDEHPIREDDVAFHRPVQAEAVGSKVLG